MFYTLLHRSSNRYKNNCCTKENLSSNNSEENLAFTQPCKYVFTVSDRRCVVSRCKDELIEIIFLMVKCFVDVKVYLQNKTNKK